MTAPFSHYLRTNRRHASNPSSEVVLCARSLVAEFREPSLDFLSIRIRERLNTELDE